MKHKSTIIAVLILLLVALGMWFWLRSARRIPSEKHAIAEKVTPARLDEIQSSASDRQTIASSQLRPRLFKSTRYPPETADEKTQWEWWRAREKADPDFEWKMPIEFYGKVVDQFGAPVAGAQASFEWVAIGGLRSLKKQSDSNGLFSLNEVQGKRLVVRFFKEGYLSTKDSVGSFEYAAFFDDLFHVPDKEHPIVFRLQKLEGAKPMNKYLGSARVPLDGQVLLDIGTGKFGSTGDLELSVKIGQGRESGGPDYSLILRAVPGAGFVFSEEEFMFLAPEGNYLSHATSTRLASEAAAKQSLTTRFYVKTRDGLFAAVEMEIILWERRHEASLNAIIYHNPSGSRNLEFDQSMWLNRQ